MTGPLRKAVEREDGSLLITGIASDASVPDCDNEILDLDRSWPFFQAQMDRMLESSGGKSCLALRISHQSTKPAGRVVKLWRSGDQIWAKAIVDEPDAIRLVKSGTLSQLSFGGHIVEREYLSDGVYALVADPRELSLCDVACNVNARLTNVEESKAFELHKKCGTVEIIRAGGGACPVSEEELEDLAEREDLSEEEIEEIQEECEMNRSDHEKMAKRHAAFAEHHSALTKLHKEATEHHTRMAKSSPDSFGEAARAGAGMPDKAVKSAYGTPGTYGGYGSDNDASGGLRKAQ